MIISLSRTIRPNRQFLQNSILSSFCSSRHIHQNIELFVQKQRNDLLLARKIEAQLKESDWTLTASKISQIILTKPQMQIIMPNIFYDNQDKDYDAIDEQTDECDLIVIIGLNQQASLVYVCQNDMLDLYINYISCKTTEQVQQYVQQLIQNKPRTYNGIYFQGLSTILKTDLKQLAIQRGIDRHTLSLLQNIQIKRQEQALQEWSEGIKYYFD